MYKLKKVYLLLTLGSLLTACTSYRRTGYASQEKPFNFSQFHQQAYEMVTAYDPGYEKAKGFDKYVICHLAFDFHLSPEGIKPKQIVYNLGFPEKTEGKGWLNGTTGYLSLVFPSQKISYLVYNPFWDFIGDKPLKGCGLYSWQDPDLNSIDMQKLMNVLSQNSEIKAYAKTNCQQKKCWFRAEYNDDTNGTYLDLGSRFQGKDMRLDLQDMRLLD